MDEFFTAPISIEALLQSKALEPISSAAMNELLNIQALDVSKFNEAEVRAYVIDPIVKILGYEKGTNFSPRLEKHLKFLNKSKYVDYNMTVFEENFWLIEAKKPRRKGFSYADLAQAVEYAAHPEINAALVVLSDGVTIEIFDREVSLIESIINIKIADLPTEFDKIRVLLGPWQNWFFQKRRVVRLLDKIFDKEFNYSRVEEFKTLIDRRLNSKRQIILDNFRSKSLSNKDGEDRKNLLSHASTSDIIDIHFFIDHSISEVNLMTKTLVDRAVTSGNEQFKILYKIFPDYPRDANDHFYMNALQFLLALREKVSTVQWLPEWLGGGKELDTAIQTLIRLGLNSFIGDDGRKAVLTAAATYRRILKIACISSEDQWKASQLSHAVMRHVVPELSWQQIVASPEGQILGVLNNATMSATYNFVRDCYDERDKFLPRSARSKLSQLWDIERGLLKEIPNYLALRKERSLGEIHPTEYCYVTYDNLGHCLLCVMNYFPRWKAYCMEKHFAEVGILAALGSWQAREWLVIPKENTLAALSEDTIAERFFWGEVAVFRAIRDAYKA